MDLSLSGWAWSIRDQSPLDAFILLHHDERHLEVLLARGKTELFMEVLAPDMSAHSIAGISGTLAAKVGSHNVVVVRADRDGPLIG